MTILPLLLSCVQRNYDVAYPTLNYGQYNSKFPYRNYSKQLEEMLASVKIINYIVFYEFYIFSQKKMIIEVNILHKILYEHHPDLPTFLWSYGPIFK